MERTIIHEMKAHHYFSEWRQALEAAVTRLGLTVQEDCYQELDGSWTRVYWVSSKALARHGGLERVRQEAYEIQEEWAGLKDIAGAYGKHSYID